MQNSGAFPKDGPASTLSQILQGQVPLKYFLSATACLGILRRADKRGKPIIPILRYALEKQAAIMAAMEAETASASDNPVIRRPASQQQTGTA